ncbi:MAG: tyrosine-type recombinase/integrase [Clostridiales bacterium]|nr:tyrosine-type recombinase/integrase [Clostridiales bacterium]
MKKILIANAFTQFQNELILKGRKSETLEYYIEFLTPFFAFANVKYASQLSYDLVKAYTVRLRGKYENAATINTHLRAVRAFCYYCGRNNYTVPFTVNLVSAPHNIKVPYDGDTVRELVLNRELCKPSIAILMLIATGVRAKTLCNIRVEDIDLYAQTVLLRELKNNSQSVLPLPQYVCNRLKRYIREFGLTPAAYLLTTNRGKPYTTHSLYTMVTRYLKRKGYDSKGLHRFRHTFAKMTAEQGISSILLSRWLTHSSVEQSEQYVNLYGSDLRNSLKYNPIETVLHKEKSDPQ